MNINDTNLVSEWNHLGTYQTTAPQEAGLLSTEMENGFGILHTPEAGRYAHGRLTDRKLRISQIPQNLKL